MLKKNKEIIVGFILFVFGIVIYDVLSTYSLNEYFFNSSIYNIESDYIENISQKTDVSFFEDYFDMDNCKIEVVNDKNEILDGYVYTGSITNVYDKNENIIKTYTNIIKGDMNGDGVVDNLDIEKLSSYIINNKDLSNVYIMAMDMNNDGMIKSNDIALFQYYLDIDYESLELNINESTLMSGDTLRIIPTIVPSIFLDSNLVWTSSDESVATVNNGGLVTAVSEGEAIVTATTKNGKLSSSVSITVDNTIKLEKNDGDIYIGGKDVKVFIKSIDYSNLSCSSSDDTIVNCSIEDKYLVIKLPSSTRESNGVLLTVKSLKYGTAQYKVRVVRSYLSLFPVEICMAVNSGVSTTISGLNAGKLEFEVSDSDIIKSAYQSNGRLIVMSGDVPGDAVVTARSTVTNVFDTMNVYVYDYSLDKTFVSGKVSEIVDVNVMTSNLGNLSCNSLNNDIADCEINSGLLKIKFVGSGQTKVNVTDDKCKVPISIDVDVEG